MSGATPARPRIQSVGRATDVLIAVAKSDHGLTSKEITELLGTTRQGAYHLIHTLVSAGFLTRVDDNRYVLGLAVGTLAAAFGRHLAPAEHLGPFVRDLARDTGATASAAGWQNGEVVLLSVARGRGAVQAAELVPGTAEDGHARASGKLLLAFADAGVVDGYLAEHPLSRRTARTITARRAFAAELAAIRDAGCAFDREEFADGLCCVAVPIDGGASPFVLSVSAPAGRFAEGEAAYLEAARAVAARASHR